jgi:V-type H+-transporting ATPase subunit a
MFFEFIPQLIFMVFIFVYLCVMIFIKWLKFSGADDDKLIGPICAPNLLIELIQMFFLSTARNTAEHCDEIYPGQV